MSTKRATASAFTAKNYAFDDAPARTTLRGDKTIRNEPAQHIIEFPGGAIEVTRTTDGDYWAHVIVNRHPPFEDGGTRESARGEIVGSRIDAPGGIIDVPLTDSLEQIAIRIRPDWTRS